MTSEPEWGPESEEENPLLEQIEIDRQVREAYAAKFAWGRSWLVKDPKTGDIDERRTKDKIPNCDIEAAEAVRDWHGAGYFVVPDGGKQAIFRQWDGQTWRIDLGEGNAHWIINDLWEQMKWALDEVFTMIELLAEKKAEEFGATGGDAAAKKKEIMGEARKSWKLWTDFAKNLGMTRGRSNVALALTRDKKQIISEDEFDTATSLLVVDNGVLDFSACERIADEARASGVPVDGARLRAAVETDEHRSTRKVTVMTSATYDADAQCPMFLAYLERVLPDAETREYLQRVLGVGLIGRAPKVKTLLNLIGPSNTGKTVLLEVLNGVLGGYSRSTMPSTFLKGRKDSKDADSPSPALHALRKARYVTATEPNASDEWNGGLLKNITGGEEVTTRGVFGRFTATWHPNFLIILATNFFIRMDTKDEALYRRIAPIEFSQVFRKPEGHETWDDIPLEEQADENLTEKILEQESERSGILNWIIEGLMMYLESGTLGEPSGIGAFRGEMKEDLSTPLGASTR